MSPRPPTLARLTPVLLLAPLLACRSSTARLPADLEAASPRRAAPVAAWEAVCGGRAIAVVVRFALVENAAETWFSVRNPHGQELGLVDRNGRAFRFRPGAEAELLGSGTVAEGVARIVEPTGPLELVEVPLATLTREASATAPGGARPGGSPAQAPTREGRNPLP